jgi:DNA topoisomerase-1
MKLVIVESPNKISKLKSILRGEYVILPTVGHIRDLDDENGGFEVKNGKINPLYIPSKDKKAVIANLKKYAKHADEIILAGDGDREGEAICWHVMEILGKKQNYKRAVFQSITYPGVMEGMNNLRDIDMNMVNAQQARRLLDRIVGFRASEMCWKHLNDKAARSAGRVQSVALRIVMERDDEIANFKPEDYSELYIDVKNPKQTIKQMLLIKVNNKPIERMKNTECVTIQKEITKKGYTMKMTKADKENKEVFSPPCYSTSMIQQTCSSKLNMNPNETMQHLQKLFEEGHITYHRTDSVFISKNAIDLSRKIIEDKFGKTYLPDTPIFFKNKNSNAQEAHEAIRPTDPENYPQLTEKIAKVYELIWKRFIACQMKPAIDEHLTLEVGDSKYTFQRKYIREVFDGWRKVDRPEEENIVEEKPKRGRKKANNSIQEEIPTKNVIGEQYQIEKTNIEDKQTQPPFHYTQASLIRELENRGIGRPSTYAYIMNKLVGNRYCIPKGKVLEIAEVGKKIVNLMKEKYHDNFIEINFTKEMEENLDKIADGKMDWNKYVYQFNENFQKIQ